MLASRLVGRLRPYAGWFTYVAVALVCTRYLNERTNLVPKWGQWYPEGEPLVVLQVRAFLEGHTALVPHPSGAGHDYNWGRGGMHQAWGVGVPLLATPFHLIGRLFGAPGFPDDVRILVFYAATAVALSRALHKVARDEPTALVASAGAAGFVMVFPTFVGMIASRFLIYEQTIAVGALWNVALLAGLVSLVGLCTPGRLAVLCGAAGFSLAIRPPLGVYGLSTVVLALLVARRAQMRPRALIGGLLSYAAGTSIYCIGNVLRFGSAFNAGYANSLSGSLVNRLTRWGLPFAHVPFSTAAKEMFVTLFLMDPVTSQVMMGTPPASVLPYVTGERWREYYAPTYDRIILFAWVVAVVAVAWRVISRRLWRQDRPLDREVLTVVGAWSLFPSIVLFVFYTRVGNMVTRYASDLYPAFAAATLCAGMVFVDAVRSRVAKFTAAAQLGLAAGVALYLAGWPAWATGLSHPVDSKAVVAGIAAVDARAQQMPSVPDHFKCNEPRGPSPMHTHLEDWHGDCTFSSGMVFAMPRARCVQFTFEPHGTKWDAADQKSIDSFLANADSDAMVPCRPASVEGETHKLTVCESRPPRYLLDGMRLYSIASLDDKLVPIDTLRLMRIDPAPDCR